MVWSTLSTQQLIQLSLGSSVLISCVTLAKFPCLGLSLFPFKMGGSYTAVEWVRVFNDECTEVPLPQCLAHSKRSGSQNALPLSRKQTRAVVPVGQQTQLNWFLGPTEITHVVKSGCQPHLRTKQHVLKSRLCSLELGCSHRGETVTIRRSFCGWHRDVKIKMVSFRKQVRNCT